jgi:dipeptidyl aminopeptidase/acylaminoacyl peptidase
MDRMGLVMLSLLFFLSPLTGTAQKKPFEYLDVFELQYATDPQIRPQGDWIAYRRMGFDILEDRAVGNLWMVRTDGTGHQKMTSREVSESSPVWSPDGQRLAFVSATDEGSEIYLYWMDSGKFARLTQLPGSPGSLSWSPDGRQLAFTMNVPEKAPVIAKLPPMPKNAKWAGAARITDRLYHEADGRGYIPPGFSHLFVIPSEGGAARQVSSGEYHHRGPLSWSADGSTLYFSGNRTGDWEYDFRNSEVYSLELDSGNIAALTDSPGPDQGPVASPDGKYIAYTGYTDRMQAHQTSELRIMNADGSGKRTLAGSLDRSVSGLTWDSKSRGLYVTFDDKGNTKIGYVPLSGEVRKLADNLGGTSIGRPYGGGSFSVSDDGTLAYTLTRPEFPADIAVLQPRDKAAKRITQLNRGLLDERTLGRVEEIWYKSTVDGRDIQGWIVYPPDYQASKKYPFLVENHGGPISNYGDRFTAEIQLYAAAGYIVFYPNPRGSTSYGEDFANQLYNNYPGDDYQDVMDGVDACIAKGIAHEDQLFVTGGSAGGIMTAWIIGKNDRFEAAVVAKPVVNWISKTLVADNYFQYANSRYPGQPWENFEGYWNFSPLSLVGNVKTPTMVLVGMNDLRTPPSEAKQLYHALKLRKVETVLVEIPEAGHGIANRPSNLISKVAHTLAWMDKYRDSNEN